ncbi:MAG: amino acid adenylation domain-containing protein, partial [Pseudonocardiales bacterium]
DNPRERLAQIADHARVRGLLTETELDGLVDVGEATTLLVDADRDLVGGYPSDPPPAVTGHDNLAYIIYTSGSTGRPKGVACHHRGLVNYLAGAVAAYACRGTGGAPVFSSFGFDMIVPDLYVPLLMGQTVHLLPDPLEPADLGAELARRAPFAFIKMTPGHLQLLAEQLTPDQARGLAGTLVVGADSFHAATLARWRELDPETVVLNEYGPTEASVANSTYRTGDADLIPGSADVLPIGTPVPNTTLYVLDRELNPVPSGVTGEIYIGGTCCARGYLGRAAQTAQRFVPDPFIGRPGAVMYRTGDLGKWRADGNLRFVDRSDRQVKLRGYRIEPGEVEARLVEHPAVHQARCVVRTDGATVRLAAYVVLGTDLDTDIGDDELPDWCARRLPSYMVPATFTTIDTLPLDPNGKVDERRLPAPGESAGAAKPGSLAPRTDLERRLLQVWIDVLKRDDIGVRDNFFDLGGDSILSIQLIAAGRRAGLRLTPKQIFGHPTIEALAAHVTEFVAAPGAAAAAEPGDGRTPLSPIQRWLTAQRLPHAEHYNQSVLIDFDAADAGRLQRALDAVVDRHDALRQRFVDDDTFCAVGERGDSVPVDEVDLTEVADATESRRRAEQTANAAQAALDLATGRLVRAVVFRHGPNRSDQVLIVVHHLAVDNLSWPTILDTLKAAYDEQPLPDSGSTFAEWGRRIQDVEAFASQHDYWYSALDDAAEVPVDHRDDDRADTVESTDVVTVALSAAETDALLHDGPLAYHMRVEDVFVTGLAQVFSGWMDSDDVVIDLESHGREQLHEDLDISRTVGWFTSAYPVRLTLPSRGDRDTDLAQALKSVKDTLRAVPDSGIGYGVLRRLDAGAAGRRLRTLPEPSIVVNYTGRTESSASPFDMAAQTLGAERAGDQPRSHTIELEAAVRDGVLEVAWTYSHNRHERGTVERLANGHLDRLRALVAHCQAHPGGHTPGDFPLARLDFEELDQLLADAPDIADIYPLTPLQEGMLFHALLSPETGDNYSQEVFVLEGDVDADVVERACRAAAARHPAMRTTIVWDGLSKPMQVVHASSELDVRRLDWSEHDPAAWSDEIDALLAAERADIPDLETAPPIRVTLIRDSATKCRLVLSFHHILLDGWSVHVLMSEIAAIYWALSRGEEPRLPAATPYQRFVESIAHEDTGPARAFWAGMLDGYVPPAQLPEVLAGPQPGGSDAFESDASESEVASVRATLDADDSAALRELAGQSRFTVNTVALAAWAMLLANYSRADDVVVGVSVSGRPVGLSGAASMVGLLSNTLPVRAMMGVGESVEQLLTRLQSMQLDMREFESSSLADIQTTAGIQRGSRLFESIFVFESSILATPEDDASNLRLTLDRAIESTGYPLNVIVRDDDCLEVKVLYQPGRVSEDGASRLVADLVAVLTGLATSLRRPVADFVDLVSVG